MNETQEEFDQKLNKLREKKFNSVFSEARRSLLSLFSYSVKNADLDAVAQYIFDVVTKERNIKKELTLAPNGTKTIFAFTDESKAGKISVLGRLSSTVSDKGSIAFAIEGITDRKYVSSGYEIKRKKNRIIVHFTEYVLSDIPWDNINGRIARFYYVRELKKRQRKFVEFMNQKYQTRKAFSFARHLTKIAGSYHGNNI